MRKLLTLFVLLGLSAGAWAQTAKQPDTLIRNATVLTASHGTLANTDVLLSNGKIAKIGKGLTATPNARVIDGTGKYVMPGIFDGHSHTMIDGGVNECTKIVSAMARIEDVLNSGDINLYRELAGGVTALNILHGSCNSIGGQNAVVKVKYGHPIEDFFFGALPGIKFALGENPKRSNNPGGTGPRRCSSWAPVWPGGWKAACWERLWRGACCGAVSPSSWAC